MSFVTLCEVYKSVPFNIFPKNVPFNIFLIPYTLIPYAVYLGLSVENFTTLPVIQVFLWKFLHYYHLTYPLNHISPYTIHHYSCLSVEILTTMPFICLKPHWVDSNEMLTTGMNWVGSNSNAKWDEYWTSVLFDFRQQVKQQRKRDFSLMRKYVFPLDPAKKSGFCEIIMGECCQTTMFSISRAMILVSFGLNTCLRPKSVVLDSNTTFFICDV